MSQLLYAVGELFADDGYLAANQKKYFNIPLYQRGYKWDAEKIRELLTDIRRFNPDKGKFYCLQNITIVPSGDYFNVVDGQQRLTTLTLILAYLQHQQLVRNKIRFPDNSIRKETNRFLNDLITSEHDYDWYLETDWNEFIDEYPNYDHQDIYYLFHGYHEIEKWFDENEYDDEKLGSFARLLLNEVKLIVNLIDSPDSEEKIFVNLNSKRVPLDGADLIRAMIITRVANEEGKRESDIKNIVRVNERRVRIGWELDQMGQWWAKTEVKEYFGRFNDIKSYEPSPGVKSFNDNLYPINLLYMIFAARKGSALLHLKMFEAESNQTAKLYKELLHLHYTVQDWFSDKRIYHYLGFLFSTLPTFNFNSAWAIWEKSRTRKEFTQSLKNRMKDTILIDSQLPDYLDNEIDWYHDQQTILVRSLILMDILYALRKEHPFMPVKAFTKNGLDIEHIFPQNPLENDDIKAFVEFLNKYFVKDKQDFFDLTGFDERINIDDEYYDEVQLFINKYIGEYHTNSIGNLVLLDAGINRGLRNKPYKFKRSKVIHHFQKGDFIQPHTFQIYTRYINDPNDENFDLMHWTNRDIDKNALFITDKIKQFFQADEQ